jgi:hypothetical protein
MATLTATAAQSTVPAKYRINGTVTRVVDYSLGATGNPNLSTGDVIQMVRVPAGACIVDISLCVDQLSGGNYTFGIGDGNAAGRYYTSLSSGSTSAMFIMSNAAAQQAGVGYSYSAEDTIDITASTVTTATASGVLRLVVSYTLDNL